MLKQQVKKADMRAVFTEYAWDMNWCDPGAADPLSFEELRSLGVFWSNETSPDLIPGRGRRSVMPPMDGARDVFVESRQVRYGTRRSSCKKPFQSGIRNQLNLPTVGNGKRWQNLWTPLPAAA